MKVDQTERGFDIVEFEDSYGMQFSVQASSNVDPHLWVGPRKPEVKTCVPGKGWSDFPLPEGVHAFSRGHLDRKMVRGIVKLMRRWLRTGLLAETEEDAADMAARRKARLEIEAKAAAFDAFLAKVKKCNETGGARGTGTYFPAEPLDMTECFVAERARRGLT